MAKKSNNSGNQLNLTVIALVALVAIVGLVALVLNVAPGGIAQASAQSADGNTVGEALRGNWEVPVHDNYAGTLVLKGQMYPVYVDTIDDVLTIWGFNGNNTNVSTQVALRQRGYWMGGTLIKQGNEVPVMINLRPRSEVAQFDFSKVKGIGTVVEVALSGY